MIDFNEKYDLLFLILLGISEILPILTILFPFYFIGINSILILFFRLVRCIYKCFNGTYYKEYNERRKEKTYKKVRLIVDFILSEINTTSNLQGSSPDDQAKQKQKAELEKIVSIIDETIDIENPIN